MTTSIWIAEKASAAKDLVAGLSLAFGGKASYKSGYYQFPSGDIVLPLRGHVLEAVRPGEYLSEKDAEIERTFKFDEYKSFLPILPGQLKLVPKCDPPPASKAKKGKGGSRKPGEIIEEYKTAVQVLKSAKGKRIINAGDIDREGQLIVDELLRHVGIDPYGPNVFRFGIASNLASDIAAAVQLPLDRNGDERWRRAADAAETRAYLDYVWGMNFSMVGQVRQRKASISAGRVQTPVLSMVVERCKLIENFKPLDYFVPVITLKDGTQMRWKARPGAEGTPGFDLQGRIVSEALAQQIVDRIKRGLPGDVTRADVDEVKEKPPLGYSLSALQSTAARKLECTLEQAGKVIKGLRDNHKAISYIGTDCKYLPESMHAQAPALLRQLAGVAEKAVLGANVSLKSKIFNDAKLDEHYAIIPTGELPRGASAEEMTVFRLVVNRFIAQFYPDYVYAKHSLEAKFGADQFSASDRQELRQGWREVDGESVADADAGGGGQQQRDADGVDDMERPQG